MPFMKPYMVKLLREQFPPGTRIRLDSMMNDPQPIPKGMTGTVQGIDDAGQLLMEWDNGRGLSLVPGEDDFTVVKPQKLKLYMPLALGYYEKNDWGDYEDEELTLSDDDAVGYADTITGALERESKFLNTPRGFMEYYNRSDGVDAKVRSLFFKAEARNGKLWGVAECMVSGELNGEELAKLKDYINWYTLAGSRHYMSDTKWNQNISYIKIATANTTIGGKSFAKAGIYVSTDFAAPSSDNASDVDAAVALATWTGIPQLTGSTYPKTYTTDTPAAAAWWPEYASNENYGNVWNIGNAVNGVSWLRNGTAEVITYTGVTTVEDDMVVLNEGATAAPTQAEMTDVYQWGYADVRVNGSQYGTVVNNPYAAAPSTDAGAGGDGFDLSWAVKADGTPIALSSVRYVRVYSAVLFSAGVFGETSAEVCGLYVANAESSSVGTTAAPAITLADGPIPLDMATSMGNNVFYIPAETFEGAFTSGVVVTATASSSTAKVFINGESTGTFTIQDASRGVQILVQDGNSAPFILVIK